MRSGVRHNFIKPRGGRNHKPRIVFNGLTNYVYDQLFRMSGRGSLRKVQSNAKQTAALHKRLGKQLKNRFSYENCVLNNNCLNKFVKIEMLNLSDAL